MTASRRAGSCPPSRAGCGRPRRRRSCSSASPGEPTPTPASSSVSTPAAEAASRSAAAIASATSCGPPWSAWDGVLRRAPCRRHRRSPSGSSSRRGQSHRAAQSCAAVYAAGSGKLRRVAGEQTGWRIWWAKRRWYERNRRLSRRWRLARHAARGGFFIRQPVEGELLEALDEGRLRIGEGTLLEPGCWLTLAPRGADRDRRRLLPQPQHDAGRAGEDRDRRPHDVRQRLLRRRLVPPLRRSRTRRSPSRASPRRARSGSAPTAGLGSTASSPAA